MRRRLRRFAKRQSFRAFVLGDRLGVHVLPKHYYTPVPDMAWLRANQATWAAPVDLSTLGWDLDEQLSWLDDVCAPYYDEVRDLGAYTRLSGTGAGLGYGPIESQVLHCFVRRYNPRRIVEIGSGVSTMCILAAIERNVDEGSECPTVTCIEPYASEQLKVRREITLLEQPVQTVDPAVFAELSAGDLLFVDSSHAVKVGSDTLDIYLRIFPHLAPGVVVHIHDIYLPYLHPRDALTSYFWPQETALLTALLMGNSGLRVLCSQSALHYSRTTGLRTLLSDYDPRPGRDGLDLADGTGHFPSSLYLTVEK